MKDSSEQERQIPIALRAAYLALHRKTEARFAEHDVTADQFVLMLALDGESLTQRELADRIASDPSTVRAMLVLLEGNGLVERSSHPDDSRAKLVSLTPVGKRKLKKLWKAGQTIRNTMYGSMTAEEAETLISLLRTLTEALQPKKQILV